MIDAREVIKNLKLPAQDEAEVKRLGEEIATQLRSASFDGRPFNVDIPAGADDEQRERCYRIVNALQRRFQAQLWNVYLETSNDAFGQPQVHRLWFALDAAATREPVVATQVPANGFSLRALYNELSVLYGAGGAPLPSKPVLSVILGTYNRLSLLQAAIASIRSSAGSCTYEIIVTDGGSTDGSRAWLAAQPDVILVGERRLDGAVVAFNQAFLHCRGEFVANANDDVVYQGLALEEGVKYLQAHPEAGQVAFALRGEGEEWVVNSVHGGRASTVYANHGVVRKEIADQVARIQGGFWHPMYHTYAGDCEMSAWVWRLGHRVVALPHLRVLDSRPDDGLREKNKARFGSDTKRMYARWPEAAFRPNGPEPRVSPEELARYREIGKKTAAAPVERDVLTEFTELVGFPEPGEERRLRKVAPLLRALDPVHTFPKRADRLSAERVLHVHINGEKAVDQQEGLVRALKELGRDGYRMVRWTDLDHAARQEAILSAAKDLSPTLVFMQLQTPGVVDAETIKKLREIAPKAVIATWCGDIASENRPFNVDWQVQIGRLVDLTMHSSVTHVRALRAAGVHNAIYLQIGIDDAQYHPADLIVKEGLIGQPVSRYDYDVAFLGSRYGAGDAFSSTYNWKNGVPAHDATFRDEVVLAMRDVFGKRFGLFGSGWDNNLGAHKADCKDIYAAPCACGGKYDDIIYPIPVTESHRIYQKSRIGLSISLDNNLEMYTSDRALRILACGALLLVKRFPGMEALGLEHGKSCAAFDTVDEAVNLAKNTISLLDGEDGDVKKKVEGIAQAGAALARDHHTWTVRMLELQPYLDAVRTAR